MRGRIFKDNIELIGENLFSIFENENLSRLGINAFDTHVTSEKLLNIKTNDKSDEIVANLQFQTFETTLICCGLIHFRFTNKD